MASRPLFVGRVDHLSELRKSVDELLTRRGGIVLVEGELGIGKSRLGEELVDYARGEKIGVFTGRWYETREMPAYIGFRDALIPALGSPQVRRSLDRSSPYLVDLARLGSEFADALGLESDTKGRPVADEKYRLWRAVSLLLHSIADVTPAMLFLDDLHWADRGSLELLAFLGRELRALPILILDTYRGEELTSDHPLRHTIVDLTHQRVLRLVRLGGLSVEEVGILAADIAECGVAPELVEALHQHTAGNPLFIEELMTDVIDGQRRNGQGPMVPLAMLRAEFETPVGIREIMARRLSRVTPECRHVLSIAAIVGRNFDFAIVEAVTNLDRGVLLRVLDEAVQAAMIREVEPSVFAFSHPLLRTVIDEAMTSSRRLMTHLEIANSLENLYGSRAESHSVEIASHFIAAGDLAEPEKLITFALAGARQARLLFAFAEARSMLNNALNRVDRVRVSSAGLRVQILIELGYAESFLGHPDVAIASYREALALCEAESDEEGATDARRWLAGSLIQYGRSSEGLDVTRRGLAEATDTSTYAYHGLVATHAMALMLSGSVAEAQPWVARAMELSFDDTTLANASHVNAAWHSWGAGDRREADGAYRRARSLLVAQGFDSTAGGIACDHAVAAYFLGSAVESDAANAECERLVAPIGRVATLADVHALRSLQCVHRGDWAGAAAEREDRRRLAPGPGGTTIYGHLALRGEALEAFWKRGPAPALEFLEAGFPLNQPLIAAIRIEDGERDTALQHLETVQQFVPSQGRGLFWLAAGLPVVSALCTLGSEAASDWYAPLVDYQGCMFDWFMVDTLLGRICSSTSQWDSAERHLTRAVEVCEERGFAPFLGEARYHLALALLGRRNRGDRKRARSLLETAGQTFAELGMTYMHNNVQTVLAVPQRGRPSSSLTGGLTEREFDVLALLVQGKTNRDIGALLFISNKTAEHHVSNICAKLGSANRSAAAARAIQEGWIETRRRHPSHLDRQVPPCATPGGRARWRHRTLGQAIAWCERARARQKGKGDEPSEAATYHVVSSHAGNTDHRLWRQRLESPVARNHISRRVGSFSDRVSGECSFSADRLRGFSDARVRQPVRECAGYHGVPRGIPHRVLHRRLRAISLGRDTEARSRERIVHNERQLDERRQRDRCLHGPQLDQRPEPALPR